MITVVRVEETIGWTRAKIGGALAVACFIAGACARSRPHSETTTTAADWISAPKPAEPGAPDAASSTLFEGWSASECTIACRDASGRRMASAAEARLVSALDPLVARMRSCPAGNPPPPLVLRFDSGGALTSFGVDAGGVGAGGCIGAFRESGAALTYPGPAVIRCTSDCPP